MIKWWTWWDSTLTWLRFEAKTSLQDKLKEIEWYTIINNRSVYFNNRHVAEIYQKHNLYKYLLEPNNIDYTDFISKKLLPDNAIYVIIRKTLYIIEIKYQEVAGSVDEKLQTCDFKKKQYQRLLSPLNLTVEYCYVLRWARFQKPEYKDVLNYIQAVWCKYFFDELPLDYLWLPVPENKPKREPVLFY